jgi:hypothetical protein
MGKKFKDERNKDWEKKWGRKRERGEEKMREEEYKKM